MRSRTLLVTSALLALAACGGDDGAGPAVTPSSDVPTTPSDTVVPTMAQPAGTAPGSTPAPGSGAPEGVVNYAGLKQDHTPDDVAYPQNPPVGGPHDPQWQPCGVFDSPIRTERGVHSMEHGAVWVTYEPGLAADQVALIAAAAAGHDHVLVSPFDGLPAPVVASAWGEQLVLTSASDPRLVEFVAFFEEGPQTPEPGAPC